MPQGTGISELAGGLGLFLVGLWMATDGIKVIFGRALREALLAWNESRWRAFWGGALIGSLVPSSGNLTLATLGFVNAGRVRLIQALWILLGCSCASALMAWTVAATGFNPMLPTFAWSAVASGALLRWAAPGTMLRFVGQTIAGLGLLLTGLIVTGGSFEALGSWMRVTSLEAPLLQLPFWVLVGATLAVLTQSSAAALVLGMFAASSGVLGMASAAALLIGAHVGASSAAVLALWRGSAEAKRIAVGQMMIHAVAATFGVVLWLCLRPILPSLAALAGSTFVGLALFQTAFCVGGVLVCWPLLMTMRRFLEDKFLEADKDLVVPSLAEDQSTAVPELTLEAMLHDLTRIAHIARDLARPALTGGQATTFRRKKGMEIVTRLTESLDQCSLDMHCSAMPHYIAGRLVDISAATTKYRQLFADIEAYVTEQEAARANGDASRLRNLEMGVLQFIESNNPFERLILDEEIDAEVLALETLTQRIEAELLRDCAGGVLDASGVSALIRRLRTLASIVDAVSEASGRLAWAADWTHRPSTATVTDEEEEALEEPVALDSVPAALPQEPPQPLFASSDNNRQVRSGK